MHIFELWNKRMCHLLKYVKHSVASSTPTIPSDKIIKHVPKFHLSGQEAGSESCVIHTVHQTGSFSRVRKKRVKPSHSLKHIFRTKYSHKPRICYLWSVGPLLFLHIFISILRIDVDLGGNFVRRWIHQKLKTCVSENWLKWDQMFVKFENMMIKFFAVIKSIRTCRSCSSWNFGKKYKMPIKRQNHVMQHDSCRQ